MCVYILQCPKISKSAIPILNRDNVINWMLFCIFCGYKKVSGQAFETLAGFQPASRRIIGAIA